MSDFTFMGSDGRTHKPSDPDYWQAKTRELEGTVRELTKAIVDIQHRLSRLDGEELEWPGNTYKPDHTEPVGVGSERVNELEDQVAGIAQETVDMVGQLDEAVRELKSDS